MDDPCFDALFSLDLLEKLWVASSLVQNSELSLEPLRAPNSTSSLSFGLELPHENADDSPLKVLLPGLVPERTFQNGAHRLRMSVAQFVHVSARHGSQSPVNRLFELTYV